MWKHFTTIEMFGEPVPKGLVSSGRGIANSSKTRQAMERRKVLIRNHRMRGELQTIKALPIRLRVFYYHSRPKHLQKASAPSEAIYKTTKPDIDNLTKLLLDCCTQSQLWDDDAQVCLIEMHDLYTELNKPSRTVIIVMTGDKNEYTTDT
jgi:Holliday junction resolvase RusA-like endonuclease